MQMRNLIKEKIAANGYAVGAFVASSSATNCEILAMNGYDFVIIDCEHAQTDSETAVNMFEGLRDVRHGSYGKSIQSL